MIANIPSREELFEKQIQLENENKKLWDVLKEKNSKLVALGDKLLVQEDLLKSQVELKKLLNEYLETIRSLQRNLVFLQKENKILEQKFYKSQMAIKQLQSGGDGADQKALVRENAALKMKLHGLERELRRNRLVWDKNLEVSGDIMAARETIMNLEQKLVEYQPIVTDYKLTKSQLLENDEKLKTASFMNAILKDELEKAKAGLKESTDKNEELRKLTTKYAEVIAKLKDENTSMERFVEKSFRLEGALAELDDLNVMLKKQETMLSVLFDENQSLKEGIGRLFDDMNVLKDRNWKLERYANDMEDSYYKVEKNANNLEHKLDYYNELQVENEKLKFHVEETGKVNKQLENENNELAERLESVQQKLDNVLYTMNVLKREKEKLASELSTLRTDFSKNNAKIMDEKEFFRRECDKQKLLLNNYSHLPADFKALQKKFSQAQDTIFCMKEDLRRSRGENNLLKEDLRNLDYQVETLKADRERYQTELKNAESKLQQLEYQLGMRRPNANFENYL